MKPETIMVVASSSLKRGGEVEQLLFPYLAYRRLMTDAHIVGALSMVGQVSVRDSGSSKSASQTTLERTFLRSRATFTIPR
jgi:hypothetical protein